MKLNRVKRLGKKMFHEVVLSGNQGALEKFYNAKHQSPVLGRAEFVEKVRKPEVKLDREIPRYQRRGVQASPEEVIGRVAGMYAVAKESVLNGVRGKENEARKVAVYLVRRCCDQTLSETARFFGLGSYGAVGWGCHAIQARMEKEKKFRDRVEILVANICQQKI